MTVNIEQKSPVEAKLKIQVPAAIVNQRLNDYFGHLARQARVPGFRPGKAPAHVVKQMYRQEAASDLSERLIAEFLGKAVDEHKLDLAMPPLLLATDMPSDDKDFSFEVEVHLRPRIEKVVTDGLTIEVAPVETVTDEEVESELQIIREADATFADVKEPRPAADKDCVVVTYSGQLDGVADPRMAAENQTAFLGQSRFLPDFEKAIVGMKVGETKTFDCGFPGDYHEASLQGKSAQFTLTLNSIKEKIIPELTDEFAKSCDLQAQTVAELKSKIKEQLQQTKERSLDQDKRDAIGDALVAKNPVEVSQRQVNAFAQKLAEQTHQMMHQMGMQHEETEEHAKKLFESSLKKAERDVKLSYILEAIARTQKFEVGPEDYKRRFEETAKRTGYSVTQIQQYYSAKEEGENLSRMDRLKIDIQDEKSLDYALSRATIKSKDK